MNRSKSILLASAGIALTLLGVALYLQHVEQMQPCPLCVMQRYAFVAIALIGLIGWALPAGGRRVACGVSSLAALIGAGIAGWHVWIQLHPAVSCGIDPLETSLNRVPIATLMPFLFKADGLCSTDYAPIFSLSIPQWSLLWFVGLALLLVVGALRRR